MFNGMGWKEWTEHIGLTETKKEKKVEVMNFDNMKPEDVKKHIFGIINKKEESNDLLECDKCKKTDKDLVWCALYRAYKVKFKIKEQKNGR